MKSAFPIFISLPILCSAGEFPSIADKSIQIDGVKVAYRDEGKGQVILCLHALGHSSKDFSSLYKLPLEDYRVIAMDFPGQGRSQSAGVPASSSHFHEITDKFIRSLGLKDIVVVGNSIGGAVALRLAENNPNVRMLSLSNPAGLDKRGLISTIFINHMIRFFQRGVRKEPSFLRKFGEYYRKVLPTDSACARRNEIVDDAYRLAPLLVEGWSSFKSKQEDLRPIVKHVKCPVLSTWAMKDRFVRFGRNRKALSGFGNHTLMEYEIGHTPYLEAPERFQADLLDFMEKKRNWKP
jgi:pimeloyl-ACP methyl ester carboxylesterase